MLTSDRAEQVRSRERPLARILGVIVSGAIVVVVSLSASLLFGLGIWRSSVVVDGVRYFALGDDAMISMRYAQNAAAGSGLVWNPGDRVQGFTNVGWTLLMVIPHALGVPQHLTSLVVQLSNLCLHVGLITLVFVVLRPLGRPVACLAAFLTAMSSPVLVWGIAGFETTLQALLVTAALLPLVPPILASSSHTRLLRIAPVVLGVACVVRPDSGVLLVVVSLVLMTASLWQSPARRALRTSSLLPVAIGFVFVAGTSLWQKSYYGEWVPNTAVLKASNDARDLGRGVVYVGEFVSSNMQVGLLLPALLYILWGLADRHGRRAYVPITLVLGSWTAYVVWVGGDAFPNARFFIPVIPVVTVLASLAVHRCLSPVARFTWMPGPPYRATMELSELTPRVIGGVAALVLCSMTALISPYKVYEFSSGLKQCNMSSILTAQQLSHMDLPSNVLIAVHWAGTTPYFMSKYKMHDLLGKSDAYIARTPAKYGGPGHNKWDYSYSINLLQPDIIITGGRFSPLSEDALREVRQRTDLVFTQALWADPEFIKWYVQNNIPVPGLDGSERCQWAYARSKG